MISNGGFEMELDFNAMTNIDISEQLSVLSAAAWIENDVLPGGDKCDDCWDHDNR